MSFYWFANHPDIEMTRYHTELGWRRNLVNELEAREVDVVLDVGANSGQYATGLREAEFKGRIVSFEPLSGPFSLLERRASGDPLWDCRQYALGDYDGVIAINVAGNAGASSSVLPMLKSHEDVFPAANYIGTENVTIWRLDTVAQDVLQTDEVAFLKLDVQGFEKRVVTGGKATLNDRCVGAQIELSFLPLYEDGMLIQEALDLLYSSAFTLQGFAPVFIDVRNGQVLQADGVFFRADKNRKPVGPA